MSFRDISVIVSQELGLDYTNTDELELLRNLCTRAAREIWDFDDLPGSLMECILLVPFNKQVALPSYIGELRAMREHFYGTKIELTTMHPRYHYNAWGDTAFRHFRLKYNNAIYRDITNAGPLFLQSTVENPPATVIIEGSTPLSSSIVETILMSSPTMQSQNSFSSIKSIQRLNRGTYDIHILDVNGIEYAVLENNKVATSYIICDLTQMLFNNWNGVSVYVEVLYKIPFVPFYDLGDTFPCEGFDAVIAMKACEIKYRGQDGKETKMQFYKEQSAEMVANRIHSLEGPILKQIQFTPNPIQDIHSRHHYVFGSFLNHR